MAHSRLKGREAHALSRLKAAHVLFGIISISSASSGDRKITKSMKMMMMLMVMSMMTRLMIRLMLMIAIKMKMMMYGARQVESLDNNVMMITHYS